jgi:hypothetical protein
MYFYSLFWCFCQLILISGFNYLNLIFLRIKIDIYILNGFLKYCKINSKFFVYNFFWRGKNKTN